MTEQEVLKLIGKNKWDAFIEFMKGQTMGLDPITNKTDYYDCDVYNFIKYRKAKNIPEHKWD